MMTRTPCETGKLLEWLGEVLRAANRVDVVIVGQPGFRSSVQIILHDVPDDPGTLGGLEVGALAENPAHQAPRGRSTRHGRGQTRGSQNEKVVPRPGVLVNVSSPPR